MFQLLWDILPFASVSKFFAFTALSRHNFWVSLKKGSPFLPPANEVWGKVMFLHLSVIVFTEGGVWRLSSGQTPPLCRQPPHNLRWQLKWAHPITWHAFLFKVMNIAAEGALQIYNYPEVLKKSFWKAYLFWSFFYLSFFQEKTIKGKNSIVIDKPKSSQNQCDTRQLN